MDQYIERVQKYFDNAHSSYDQYAQIQRKIAKKLISKVDISPNDKILDLGSGTGYIADIMPNIESIYQADISFKMCQYAQNKSKNHNTIINCDIGLLPILDSYFDIITASLVMHWQPDLKQTLAEAYRVLKPGGIICISVPIDNNFTELEHVINKCGYTNSIRKCNLKNVIDTVTSLSLRITTNEEEVIVKYYHDFYQFLKSMNRTGSNITSKKVGLKQIKTIESCYNKHFRTEHGCKTTWHIGYIIAQK